MCVGNKFSYDAQKNNELAEIVAFVSMIVCGDIQFCFRTMIKQFVPSACQPMDRDLDCWAHSSRHVTQC